jgi:hypothetical protein
MCQGFYTPGKDLLGTPGEGLESFQDFIVYTIRNRSKLACLFQIIHFNLDQGSPVESIKYEKILFDNLFVVISKEQGNNIKKILT